VTAFRHDPELAGLVADRGADCCLMHMLGEPRTMQRDPRYRDVVDDVKAFLLDRVEFAVAEGIREDRIQLDPGIGFGKTVEHNLRLLARVGGARRARVPGGGGHLAQELPRAPDGPREPAARVAATVATTVMAFERGARVFRVHDVAETVDALAVAAATLRAHGA
jgi:dihydropteroate synthase